MDSQSSCRAQAWTKATRSSNSRLILLRLSRKSRIICTVSLRNETVNHQQFRCSKFVAKISLSTVFPKVRFQRFFRNFMLFRLTVFFPELDYFSEEIKEKFNLWQIDTPLFPERIPAPYVLPKSFKALPGKIIYLSLGTWR